MTHICRKQDCAKELVPGVNVRPYRIKARNYICDDCYPIEHRIYCARYREKNREKARDDYQTWKSNYPERYEEKKRKQRKDVIAE